jgi:hypothetical protein
MTSEEFQKEVHSLALGTDYVVLFGESPQSAGAMEQWALLRRGRLLAAGLLVNPDISPREFFASITRSGRCV